MMLFIAKGPAAVCDGEFVLLDLGGAVQMAEDELLGLGVAGAAQVARAEGDEVLQVLVGPLSADLEGGRRLGRGIEVRGVEDRRSDGLRAALAGGIGRGRGLAAASDGQGEGRQEQGEEDQSARAWTGAAS